MMAVTILEGSKDKIDFSAPVEMTEQQYQEFIELLEEIFAEEAVQERTMEETRSDRLGDKHFSREWTASEASLLYELEDTRAIANKLGRSWMSVDIKRGHFLPPFLDWVDENEHDLMRDDIKNLVEEYMEDKELRKQERKNIRKKIRNIEKSISEKKDKIERVEGILERGQTESREEKGKKTISKAKEQIEKLEEKKEELEKNLEELQD
jgi:hypothetical protein